MNSRAETRKVMPDYYDFNMAVNDHCSEYVNKYVNNLMGVEEIYNRIDVYNTFIVEYEDFFQNFQKMKKTVPEEIENRFFTIIESLAGAEQTLLTLKDDHNEKIDMSKIFYQKKRPNDVTIEDDENESNKDIVDKGIFTFYKGYVFNGTLIINQPLIKTEMSMRFGLKHGDYIVYDCNGKVIEKKTYFNDTEMTKTIDNYNKSTKGIIGKIKKQQAVFLKTQRKQIDSYNDDEDGDVFKRPVWKNLTELKQTDGVYYYKDRAFTGICEEQDDSGFILSTLKMVRGKIQLVTTYDDFGNIVEKTEWKNGNPNGSIKGYYPGGELKFEGTFIDGVPDGTTKQFFKNGVLKSMFNCKMGVKNGVHKYYYESGKIKGEEFFKNDKREGPFKTFYENGHPKSKGKFKNDQEILSETKCFINDAPPEIKLKDLGDTFPNLFDK